MRFFSVHISLVFLLILPGSIYGFDNSNMRKAGLDFWNNLVNADLTSMSNFYSDQVVLIAGSELLKDRWEVRQTGEPENEDLSLHKERLLQGYAKMIDYNPERWSTAMGSIDTKNILFETAQQYLTRHSFNEADQVMIVPTGTGSDRLYFFFSLQANGNWLITHEASDY